MPIQTDKQSALPNRLACLFREGIQIQTSVPPTGNHSRGEERSVRGTRAMYFQAAKFLAKGMPGNKDQKNAEMELCEIVRIHYQRSRAVQYLSELGKASTPDICADPDYIYESKENSPKPS